MPLFIKSENFTKKTLDLSPQVRNEFLAMHKRWVEKLRESGENISSGYLIDKNHKPGGGGYLVLEATSFKKAKCLIEQDPMIRNNLVSWHLHEWVPVVGRLLDCKN